MADSTSLASLLSPRVMTVLPPIDVAKSGSERYICIWITSTWHDTCLYGTGKKWTKIYHL